ncbi:hypothetical protein MKZ38_010601 [Zalerion maritima]|uniref:Protein kinase domain-containing protein n=1 Tax=Zalerion maritima TaxID=339359 RepID=A0AAD5RS35_9PEZI|nr:hypothetical protein MKZ38_010601 [Zalerion maritima]
MGLLQNLKRTLGTRSQQGSSTSNPDEDGSTSTPRPASPTPRGQASRSSASVSRSTTGQDQPQPGATRDSRESTPKIVAPLGQNPRRTQDGMVNSGPFISPSPLRTGSTGNAQLDASFGNEMTGVPHQRAQAISERSPYINIDGGRYSQIDKLDLNLDAGAEAGSYQAQSSMPSSSVPTSPSGIVTTSFDAHSVTGTGGQFDYATPIASSQPVSPVLDPNLQPVTLSQARDQIRSAKVKSSLRNSRDYFVPYPDLLGVFNQDVVFQVLEERFETMNKTSTRKPGPTSEQHARQSSDEIRQLAAKICPGVVRKNQQAYYRAFATVVMMERPELILDLLDNMVDDSQLPLFVRGSPKKLFIRTVAGSSDEENVQFKECKLGWDERDIEDFEQFQESFTAPFFSRKIESCDDGTQKARISHFQLWPNVVLPFKLAYNADEPGPMGSGAYGQVFRCELHEAHHSLPDYRDANASSSQIRSSESPQLVAVKVLTSNVPRPAFETESYILSRLTQSVPSDAPGYAHIAKILVTFEVPTTIYSPDHSQPSQYYLVFPLADANLEQFMESPPPIFSSLSSAKKTEWAAKQCWGLSEALHAFHKSPYRRESDIDPRTEGLHCDIKPRNILWYRKFDTVQDPLGVLQITDFGLASYHHPESASFVDHPAVQFTYRPPEPQLNMTSGPSFDIWSLGCLYFDLLVWTLQGFGGDGGLTEFRIKRLHPDTRPGFRADTFYQLKEIKYKGGAGVEVGITEAVYNQKANELHTHPDATQFTHDLLKLVFGDMLVVINRRDQQAQQRQQRADEAHSQPQNQPQPKEKKHRWSMFPLGKKDRKDIASSISVASPQSAPPGEIRRRISSQDLTAETRALFEKGGFDSPKPYTQDKIPRYDEFITVISTTFEQIRIDMKEKRRAKGIRSIGK